MTPLWFMIARRRPRCAGSTRSSSSASVRRRLGHRRARRLATVIANYVGLIALVIYIYVRDLPLRLRGRELPISFPTAPCSATMIKKGLPMGLQMIVISSSALATIGLVNREGVDTTAAFGVAMQLWTYIQMPAMALGAGVSAMAAQNIGAGKWDRVGAITRVADRLQSAHHRGARRRCSALADRAALALFLGGDSPAVPIAQHIQLLATWSFLLFGVTMVIFGTVRANGAVIGAADHPRHRPVPGAARLRARRLSLARRGCALAQLPGRLVRQHGDGDRLLPARRLAQGADAWRRPRRRSWSRKREADGEPGGRINPVGLSRSHRPCRRGSTGIWCWSAGRSSRYRRSSAGSALRAARTRSSRDWPGCRARRSRRCRRFVPIVEEIDPGARRIGVGAAGRQARRRGEHRRRILVLVEHVVAVADEVLPPPVV